MTNRPKQVQTTTTIRWRPGQERPGQERPGQERPGQERPGRAVCLLFATVIAIATATAIAPAAIGESPVQTFAGQLQVRLVEVDVDIEDPEGKLLESLTTDDFELLVDGEPAEIRSFEPPPSPGPDGRDPEIRPSTPATPPRTSHVVVFLDLAYLMPGETDALAEALQKFLTDQKQPDDRLTLVAADRHLERIESLDSEQPLAPRLAQLVGQSGRGQRLQIEYEDLLRSIESLTTVEDIDPLLARHPHRETRQLLARIDALAADANREMAFTGEQLELLLASVAGLPGRRVVLYLGGRMPLAVGQWLHNAWQTAFSRAATRREVAADGASTGAPAPGANQLDRLPVLETPDRGPEILAEIGRRASARGVTFVTLDASLRSSTLSRSVAEGSSALGAITGESWDYRSSQRTVHLQSLQGLADLTGGRALGADRDLTGLFETLFAATRSTYTLAFAPPAVDEPLAATGAGSDIGVDNSASELHTLEVRLKPPHEHLHLRHRRFFRSRPADREVADRTLSALLLSHKGELANPLEIELEIEDPLPAGELQRWPLTLRVPFSLLALAPETWAHSGQLSLFYTAGNLRGGALPVRKAVIPVRVANDKILDAFGRRVEYTFEVEIPNDAGALALSVRDDLATTLSTQVYPLAAGELKTPAPAEDASQR